MELSIIDGLAKLARLDMTEGEKAEIACNFSSILGYINQIQSVSAEMPEQNFGLVRNVAREDANQNNGGEYTEALLAFAPAKQSGYFKVKKIL